ADIYAELHPEKYGKKYVLKGMEQIDGADVYVVEETGGKDKVTNYYDVTTGYLVKMVQSSEQGSIVQEFSDYQEVPDAGGYKTPYAVKTTLGPQVINVKVKTVDVNKGIADSEFQ